MMQTVTEFKSKLMPMKRLKSNTPPELYKTVGRRPTIRGRLTQFGFDVCTFGTLLHLSDPTLPVNLNVLTYDENSCTETKHRSVADIPVNLPSTTTRMTWIDVDGVHDQDIISQLATRYEIHSLVEADITMTDQRTKLDICDDALFLVCKLLYRDMDHTGQTIIQQISFFVKDDTLITFQETPKDLFDSIKNRLRQGKGRLRRSRVDYLLYSILDVILDNYTDVLDAMGKKLEIIDDQLTHNLKRDVLETIYDMKRDMLSLRSFIYPLKDVITKLQKDEETGIIQESTIIYLKDLFDHVVQACDMIDACREMLASFIDLYMMLNSNNMNKVVKMLTIISTIFIPLTFISGVYGMNFENMPELRFKYGYYIILGVMGALAIVMLGCFKRNHWL